MSLPSKFSARKKSKKNKYAKNRLVPSQEPEQLETSQSKKNSNLVGIYKLASGEKIKCDSKAEAKLAQIMEDQDVTFYRMDHRKDKAPVKIVKTHRRYPDFMIPTTKGIVLLEVKGQLQPDQRRKMMETGYAAKQMGYLYAIKLAGAEDRMIPEDGYLSQDTRLRDYKDRNLNRNGKYKFMKQCKRYNIPVIATMEDIKEAFDCEFLTWEEYYEESDQDRPKGL